MALLVLEDGVVFEGEPFGATGTVCGEVVFNTGLTGYQEVLTDPSYAGQIVTMTYAHIGNCGVNFEDPESRAPHVTGFVVREVSLSYSNWRAQLSLEAYLKKYGVVGLTEVDTRALTRHIRERGAMRACLSTDSKDPTALQRLALSAPTISQQQLVEQVSCRQMYAWDETHGSLWHAPQPRKPLHVVAMDFGIKYNILRHLAARVARVTVVPAGTTAAEIIDLHPDGVLLSNGPGDPAVLGTIIDQVEQLVREELPVLGICLGHQILGLALGARSYKLKFGHRGSNQPVKNLLSGRVEITTHNHGFALADLPDALELTHVNLNDGAIEGFRHRRGPVLAVQYHPEAAPGPHDATDIFDRFVELMDGAKHA